MGTAISPCLPSGSILRVLTRRGGAHASARACAWDQNKRAMGRSIVRKTILLRPWRLSVTPSAARPVSMKQSMIIRRWRQVRCGSVRHGGRYVKLLRLGGKVKMKMSEYLHPDDDIGVQPVDVAKKVPGAGCQHGRIVPAGKLNGSYDHQRVCDCHSFEGEFRIFAVINFFRRVVPRRAGRWWGI